MREIGICLSTQLTQGRLKKRLNVYGPAGGLAAIRSRSCRLTVSCSTPNRVFLWLMKVLVLGSGGREHALVWKLRQSPRISQLYCAPGNGGIADDAECVAADLSSLDSITRLATRLQPDLTVVGPELPLTLGVVDEFTRRGWRAFGPTQAAAQLESSKSFAKEFLQRHHIPTAPFAICDSIEEVRSALGHFHVPIVVKADGLAAGKGVVIAKSKEEAASVAAEKVRGKMLGDAGAR